MNRTDTPSKLDTLLIDARQDLLRRRRRNWATGALVAAAATIATIAATITLGPPVPPEPAQQPTPAEQVASEALDAWASFDRPRIASYLAAGGRFGGWRRGNRFDEAIGYRDLNRSCVEESSTPAGAQVVCTYDIHALGSDELGLGPYPDNTSTFTIQNGEILTAMVARPTATNGFADQMWDPFAAWVKNTYPQDAADMYAHWPYTDSPAYTDHSLRLWAKHTRDYLNENK